jgi:hypothetical protein
VIAIDELQDCKDEYFVLLCKIIKANPKAVIVAVGDVMQAIYETLVSLPSDSRYLTMIDQLIERPFERVYMDESFRYSDKICEFVNRGRSLSKNQTEIIPIEFDDVGNEIKKLLREGHKKEDILVISNSARNVGYSLSNAADYPLYVADSNQWNGSDKVFRENKIEVITIHKSKGLERPIVFYILTMAKGDKHGFPILDYVAKTRAKKKLYLTTTPGYRIDEVMQTSEYGIKELTSYQHEPFFSDMRYKTIDAPYPKHEIKYKLKVKHNDGSEIVENVALHVEFATKKAVFPEYTQNFWNFILESKLPFNGVKMKQEKFIDKELTTRLKEQFDSVKNREVETEIVGDFCGVTVSGIVNLIDKDNKVVYLIQMQGDGAYDLDHKLQLVCVRGILCGERYQPIKMENGNVVWKYKNGNRKPERELSPYEDYRYVLMDIADDKWMELENTTGECERLVNVMIQRKSNVRISDEDFIAQNNRIWRNCI